MNSNVRDCLVTDYEDLIRGLKLPDPVAIPLRHCAGVNVVKRIDFQASEPALRVESTAPFTLP